MYIFFCCRAHDIIVAEQKTYQCLCGVLRYFKVTHASSHFRPLLFLLFLMVIIKISPVFNQGKSACQQGIAVQGNKLLLKGEA